jgi:outer membrane lipoprotein-sorting protein
VKYRVFLTIFLLLLTSLSLKAQVATITADTLFDQMEKKTGAINSIRVDVLLENNLHRKNCRLLIMNPDKFAIEFDDSSIQAVFNGKKLWLKIAEIKEVFYHFADSDSSLLSYIPLFNPAKIFTNLTRKSLFSLFNVTLIKQEKDAEGKITFYTLKFVPKMKSVFKEVFSIGHYLMIFSDETYLPVRVVEFDPKGDERGRLTVIKYHLNEDIPAQNFEYTPPPGYTLIPFTVVFAQKLEECGKFLVNKIEEAAKKMKKTILDWGF